MKITIEHEGLVITVSSDTEVIDDVIDLIISSLHAIGFHHESIKEGIMLLAEQYEEGK